MILSGDNYQINAEYPPIPSYTIFLPSKTNRWVEKLKTIRDRDLAPQLPYFLKDRNK